MDIVMIKLLQVSLLSSWAWMHGNQKNILVNFSIMKEIMSENIKNTKMILF